MSSYAQQTTVSCFLEQKLVKPLAVFLVLSIVSLVAWVVVSHMTWVTDKVEGSSGSSRPLLGLQMVNPDELVARMFSFPPGEAVLVDQVLDNSPAQQAGLRRGDGIIAINGRSVRSTTDVAAYLDQVKQGDLLKLTVIRGGLVYYFAVPASRRPAG